MADQKYVDLIMQGVDAWNKWREEHVSRLLRNDPPRMAGRDGERVYGIDLTNIDLSEKNLEGFNLSEVNLSSANLRRTNLKGANLSIVYFNKANLEEANLEIGEETDFEEYGEEEEYFDIRRLEHISFIRATLCHVKLINRAMQDINFNGANLSNADFSKSDMQSLTFDEGNLQEAIFRETEITDCNFRGADLSKADFSYARFFPGSNRYEEINFHGANLGGAIFKGVMSERHPSSKLPETPEIPESQNLWGNPRGLARDTLNVNLQGANLSTADLSQLDLTGQDLSRTILSQVNLTGSTLRVANLSEADLSHANLRGANLEKADLTRANLSHADLSGANLSNAILIETDLSYANLGEANLEKADLTRANLSHADLVRANLTSATLIQIDFTEANLTECSIYGASVWNVRLDQAIQKSLVITQPGEPDLTVDNLKVAQFIYLLLSNSEIREVINTITSKVVLILGRFPSERKAVLDALEDKLRQQDYSPVTFNFEKSGDKDFIETVGTLANMARFVLIDLTGLESALDEVVKVVPRCAVPLQPLLFSGEHQYRYNQFLDLRRQYRWVLPLYRWQDSPGLFASFQEKIIQPAEEKRKELQQKEPIQVFIGHASEDRNMLVELKKHLDLFERSGQIKIWDDQEVKPGAEKNKEVETQLFRARIILLLISPDFLASDDCRSIQERALERYENGEVNLIPILLRPCGWQSTPLQRLQPLPKNGLPISSRENKDAVYLEVSQHIGDVLKVLG